MPPRKPPIDPSFETGDRQVFNNKLKQIVESGEWNYLPEQQLDENFAEWKTVADSIELTDEERSWAQTRIRELVLEHVANQDYVPNTISKGVITTKKYRQDNPDDFQTSPHSQSEYEDTLGLSDTVSMSFSGHSPLRQTGARAVFTFPAGEILTKKDSLVYPFDMPFFTLNMSLSDRVAQSQAAALRGTDYIELLPYYLVQEKRGGHASDLYPDWTKGEYFKPKSFQLAEVRSRGNIDLNSIFWMLEADTRYRDVNEMLSKIDPSILTEHFIDTDPANYNLFDE